VIERGEWKWQKVEQQRERKKKKFAKEENFQTHFYLVILSSKVRKPSFTTLQLSQTTVYNIFSHFSRPRLHSIVKIFISGEREEKKLFIRGDELGTNCEESSRRRDRHCGICRLHAIYSHHHGAVLRIVQ
jgi:hypothetical protein